MYVKYDKMNGRKVSSGKIQPEAGPYYDPHKLMNKINNNKEVSVPSFRMMTSRPNSSKTTLPAYMQVKTLLNSFVSNCMIDNQ